MTSNQLLDKCGYSSTCIVRLKEDIILSSEFDTIIINAIWRIWSTVKKAESMCHYFIPNRCSTIQYVFSARHRNAKTHWIIHISYNKFILNPYYSISVIFDNWLMPDNGVAICCVEKKQTRSKKAKKGVHV